MIGPEPNAEPGPLSDRVTVVVRTAGERTAELCAALARAQAPGLAVHTISERPFAAAMRRAFEIGVAAGRCWTWCLDADVLLRDGALADLVDAADQEPPQAFCVEGRVADKLMGFRRHAGNHLYRTRLLPMVLDDVDISSDVIRPERHVKDQMTTRGHGLVWSLVDVGLHDFDQFFVDVFRKALVHSEKFELEVTEYAARLWADRAGEDPDLRVAEMAHTVRSLYRGPLRIDRDSFPRSLVTLLDIAGMTERRPLAADAFGPAEVARRLDGFHAAPEHTQWQHFCELHAMGRLGPLRAMRFRHGTSGLVRYLAAQALRASTDLLDGERPSRP